MHSLTKKNGSYYDFIDIFVIHSLNILIRESIAQLRLNDRNDLKAIGIGEWYFLQDKIAIMRYGFFEATFLFSKHATLVLITLEMGKKMVAIETKYDSRGNFKPIIQTSLIMRRFTLMEVKCKKERNL